MSKSKKDTDISENTGVSRQKQKLLFMRELLLQRTDEHHPMTVNQIINILAENGIKEERKTVYDDIATLIGSGLMIEVTKVGHANAYYVCDRLFETEELYVLVDAVASSKFLTQKKSNALIEKIKKLTSVNLAKNLSRQIDVTGRVKTFNENIYYTISAINEAIINRKMLEFQYFQYDKNKKKQLRHKGKVYRISPYKLVWENDKYYLIGYSDDHKDVTTYRVDRMTQVFAIDEKRMEPTEDINKKLSSTFNMYSGVSERVTFEIKEHLIDQMIDKFGEKILLSQTESGRLSFTAEVQISPTFWGWLFQYGNEIRITAPQNVMDCAKNELRKIAENYMM